MQIRALGGAMLAATVAAAGVLPRNAAAQAGRDVAVPANTIVRLKLEDRLSSKTNREGDRFAAVLAPNDTSGFPNGTRFQGEVIEVARPGKDEPGLLDVRMLAAYLPNGARAQLNGRLASLADSDVLRTADGRIESRRRGGKTDWKWAGYGAAGGVLLSAILGKSVLRGALLGGLGGGVYSYLNRGKNKGEFRDVDLPSGTEFGIRLEQRVAFAEVPTYRYSSRNLRLAEYQDLRSRGGLREGEAPADREDPDDGDRPARRNAEERVAGRRQEVRFSAPEVRLNGTAVAFANRRPMLVNGVAYVPLKPLAEAAKVRVEHTFGTDEFFVETAAGRAQAFAGDARVNIGARDEVTLDEAPLLINGAVYVSGEYLARVLQWRVDWDSDRNRLDVDTRE
jgi:hypothetical protein